MASSESKTWYIYCHTAPNGKRYIGQTCRKPTVRWANGKGYENNEYFTRAINAYGWDNFEHTVLCTVSSKENANFLEQWFIEKYDTFNRDHGFNLTKGGDGGLGHHVSEETRALLSQRAKERGMTPEHLEKMHEGRRKNGYRRRPMTEEERQALSERMSGPDNPLRGKKMPKEVVEKRAAKLRGRKVSEEVRKRQSVGLRNSEKVKAEQLPVLQLDEEGNVVNRYESVTRAAEAMGVTKTAINLCCKGKCNTIRGYGWEYEDEELRHAAQLVTDERLSKKPVPKQVLQLDLNGNIIRRYESGMEASRSLGVAHTHIYACCQGKQATAHGYMWRYETEHMDNSPDEGLFS